MSTLQVRAHAPVRLHLTAWTHYQPMLTIGTAIKCMYTQNYLYPCKQLRFMFLIIFQFPYFRPSFVSIFDNPTAAITNARIKQNLRRTPSEPLRVSADLFRGSHIRCDIPFYTADGIELLGFQRLGTISLPRIRSGSDPSCSLG